MKFNRKDFLNANNHIIEIDEWIAIEENDLLHHTSVKSVPDVHVTGTLEFDGMNFVSSDLSMDGTMVVLDSITNEDIDVPFEAESQQTYSFVPVEDAEDQEIIVVKKDTIDINPEIFQAIFQREMVGSFYRIKIEKSQKLIHDGKN